MAQNLKPDSMPNRYDNNFTQQLENLQHQFDLNASSRAEKIFQLALRFQTDTAQSNEIREIYRLAHNIAGSAKTFNRAELGEKALAITDLLSDVISENTKYDSKNNIKLIGLCEALVTSALQKNQFSPQYLKKPPTQSRKITNSSPVYIVEDDLFQAEHIKRIVEETGFEAKVFHSIREFNSRSDVECIPAAILMDIIFPEGKNAGLEEIENLSKNYDKNTPIIVTSVRDDIEARLSALRSGASRYLSKPIKKHKLRSILQDLLRPLDADPYRILLIDDDEILLGFHKIILEESSMEVLTLSNPMEAWQATKTFSPDVIITDVYMPKCTGPELAAILREADEFSHTPILFLSSEHEASKQISALNRGGDEFLTKPIDPERFISIVHARAQRSRHMHRINLDLKHALRERNFQQHALNQHAIVSTTDAKGNITYVNNKFCDVSGYSREELIGRNHRLLKSGQHTPEFYREIWNTIAAGEAWSGTICNARKDDTLYWVESTIVPFLGEDGIPIQYISIRTEITKLVESEDRLRRSQAFANIGTWDWNIQTGKLFWSERIAELFGYRNKLPETTYENFLAAIHPDDRQLVIDSINACVEGKAPYDIEHRVIWDDNSVHWLHEKGNVVLDAKGKPLHMLGAVQDVTARRDYQQQLESTQIEAENANRAKSEFLSSMSHELRTPLNAILGFSQLLKDDPYTPLSNDQDESIDEIIKAGDHLLELINEVLDLSRIEAGHLNLTLEAVKLADVIRDCDNLMRPLAQKHDISLETNIENIEGTILWADKTRLKQVILNFLSNAIKYNLPKGKVIIDVQIKNDLAKICVSDSGKGMSTDVMSHLFQPFNRLGAENTDIEGTGIGLIITKRLIDGMGGEIGAESEPNKGSTFWCTLPLASEIQVGKSTSRKERTNTPLDINSENTLLYIEDNPANLRLVEQLILRRPHIRLLAAPTPGLGIELATTHHPKVILLDINLPGMSGFDVLKNLRENSLFEHTPIIAVSANATQHDIEKGLKMGFDDYLTKPVNIQKLFAVLDTYLKNQDTED